MKSFDYVIKDELGVHARPAGILVKKASEYDSGITIKKGDKQADAKRLFALMSLGIKCGDKVTIICEGVDEEKAVNGMEKVFNDNV